MIFRTKLFDASWDTWMYHHDNKFYLYYLITERSHGEGVGLAISSNGVHYTDHGKILDASDKMKIFLGTGSVSESLDPKYKFIMNYSEWRDTGGSEPEQQIFFAHSDDLMNWVKFDDEISLTIDADHYETDNKKFARWDSINPIKHKECYYGVWTAQPKFGAGFALGKSLDGFHWETLAPPSMDFSPYTSVEALEVGGIAKHNGYYYIMAEGGSLDCGSIIMRSKTIDGTYKVQPKSNNIFANLDNLHAYFSRFFDCGNVLLVNFHQLLRETNKESRHYTYLSPLKKVVFDSEDNLRLYWWENNDLLRGEELPSLAAECFVLTSFAPGSTLSMILETEPAYHFTVDENLTTTIFAGKEKVGIVERHLPIDKVNMKLLIRDCMIEIYVNDVYVTVQTFPSIPVAIRGENLDIKFYELRVFQN